MDVGMNFQDHLDQFIELGGIAENICLKEGELGRGIYPIDSSRSAKIMTPANLLINPDNIGIYGDEIYIKSTCSLSTKERRFVEAYYNFAWQGGGNVCSTDSRIIENQAA